MPGCTCPLSKPGPSTSSHRQAPSIAFGKHPGELERYGPSAIVRVVPDSISHILGESLVLLTIHKTASTKQHLDLPENQDAEADVARSVTASKAEIFMVEVVVTKWRETGPFVPEWAQWLHRA